MVKGNSKSGLSKRESVIYVVIGSILAVGSLTVAMFAIPSAPQNQRLVEYKQAFISNVGMTMMWIVLAFGLGLAMLVSGVVALRKQRLQEQDSPTRQSRGT